MNEAYELLLRIREKKPLVHHITNWVTIYDCANVVRAFGALPVMAHAREESTDMTRIASSLVLNIGTLTPDLVDSMIKAGRQANNLGIPVVLDAVGAGATPLRTNETKRLLEELKITVIKGNSGEIASVAGVEAEVRGVESIRVNGKPGEIARRLSEMHNSAVAVTGKQDVIVGRGSVYLVNNGHELLGKVVGTGCMAASVIGSFIAIEKDRVKAAAYALACFGIAAELAAKKAKGPGSFKVRLYDEIFNLDEKKIRKNIKVEKQINLLK